MMDYSGLMFPKSLKVDDRKDRKASRLAQEATARDAVWSRDKGHDRATGKPLSRNSADPDLRGDWCHLQGRRVAPELRADPKGQILLSATNHALSDGRGGNRLQILDPKTLRPATDGTKLILFVMADRKGREVWRRIS